MKIIKHISEMIEDELDGAEEYIKDAVKLKEEYPELAKVFYDISLQEMNHVDMLHTQVAQFIRTHREEKGEPPAAMMAVYEYLHEKHIDRAAKIKGLQHTFKG